MVTLEATAQSHKLVIGEAGNDEYILFEVYVQDSSSRKEHYVRGLEALTDELKEYPHSMEIQNGPVRGDDGYMQCFTPLSESDFEGLMSKVRPKSQ